jgi:hypothetical protein
MRSSIWTLCAGGSEVRSLSVDAWRVVESQHQVATRRLVASDAEQRVLEDLIEGVKPPAPAGVRLHYLLFTPFRYPPLRYGSRFGTRAERGIWYGSETRATAFAEVAYYRLLFLEGTSAELGLVTTELTAFRASLRTSRGVDLSAPPFDVHAPAIASPVSYEAAQELGGGMRAAGVEAFRYPSARAVDGGVNVGAFAPSVFGRRQPRGLETWRCAATRERVEVTRRDYFERASHSYPRDQFLVDGRLPAPAL